MSESVETVSPAGSPISEQLKRWGSRLAAIVAAPFNIVEKVLLVALTAPVKPLWRRLDAYSYKLEGTRTRRIVSAALYPLLLVATFALGLAVIRNGLNFESLGWTMAVFFGFGAILAPLEHLMPWSRKWLYAPDSATDILLVVNLMVFSPFLLTPISLFLTSWLVEWIHSYLTPDNIRALWPRHWHPILQVCLLIVVKDFFRYWYHRWMHENAFMWRWHSVHHSSLRLYWFNGVRNHPLESFFNSLIWVVPLTLIQAPGPIIFFAGLVTIFIGRFQHTNFDANLGPLEYVFSGPNNHRYHHSKDISEGNRNYGGDIMLWDHVFGTFHLPKGGRPTDDIGIGGIPDFPQSWFGLTMAPFNPRLWRPTLRRRGTSG